MGRNIWSKSGINVDNVGLRGTLECARLALMTAIKDMTHITSKYLQASSAIVSQ